MYSVLWYVKKEYLVNVKLIQFLQIIIISGDYIVDDCLFIFSMWIIFTGCKGFAPPNAQIQDIMYEYW